MNLLLAAPLYAKSDTGGHTIVEAAHFLSASVGTRTKSTTFTPFRYLTSQR